MDYSNPNTMNSHKPSREEWLALLCVRRFYSYPDRLQSVLSFLDIQKVTKLADIGAGTVASVGKSLLGDRYIAIDSGDSYTIPKEKNQVLSHQVDFEKMPLPFRDREFQTTVCLDVLEHTDNPYVLLQELFRITEDELVVSLPNNWVGLLKSLLLGKNITHFSGYGLPPLPHPIGQRHKYFFNYTEARTFLINNKSEEFEIIRVQPRYDLGSDSFLINFLPNFAVNYIGLFLSSPFLVFAGFKGKGIRRLLIYLSALLASPLVILEAIVLLTFSQFVRDPLRVLNFNCRGVVMYYRRKKY